MDLTKVFRFNRIVTILIPITVIFLLASSSVYAATYYVAKGGSDASTGSSSNPWKTIAKANATLKAGDTVYIKAGTYNEMIKPARSGVKGSPITYSRYKTETVTVSNSSGSGAGLQGRSYITLNGIRFVDNNSSAIEAGNNSGVYSNITIQGCYFNGSDAWSHVSINRVDYLKVLDCTFDYFCPATSPCGRSCGYPNGDHMYIKDSHYGLFEGNTFLNIAHVCLTIRTSNRGDNTYCVIRNNTFNNRLHHALELYDKASNNLIEGNTITNAGEDAPLNYCGSDGDRTMARYKHSAMHISHASNNIIRKNLLVNCGKMDMTTWQGLTTPATKNHIYNNTIDGNQWGMHIQGEAGIYGNVFKNNIISNSAAYALYRIINSKDRDNYFSSNNFYGGSFRYSPEVGNTSLSSLQNNYKSQWSGNMSVNPGYAAPNKNNYELTSGSPMVDAGEFLTKTSSAGSGNNIPVQDAGYFSTGMGIIEGDLIQIEGHNEVLRITAISGNTITVNKSTSWKAGDGISLAYSGDAPDIGAFERGTVNQPEEEPVLAPTNLRIVATN